MKIQKFEQSGFILESTSGYKIAIDIAGFTPLEKLEKLSVDTMLVSHIHGDHFSAEHIKALSPLKLYLNKECIDLLAEEAVFFDIEEVKVGDLLETPDFKVLFFDVDHGPNAKVRPKENFGFLIEFDGEKIYFAGDMFYPSGIDVNTLEVDTALIPIGGYYTFGPKEAIDFAKQFKSIGQVIPMHFDKTPETEVEFKVLAEIEGVNI